TQLLPSATTSPALGTLFCADDSTAYSGVQVQCYDLAGNVVFTVDADQRDQQTTYDGANRAVLGVATIYSGTSLSTITTTAGYDPNGNTLTTTTQPQGQQPVTDTASFNATDWVTGTLNTYSPTSQR